MSLLLDFQQADVDALLAHDATGVVAAETGAGKTRVGVAVAHRSGLPVKFIVAPQGTHRRVWGETIRLFDPEARVRRVEGSVKGREVMSDLELNEPGWYLMTPQLFTRWKPLHLRPDFMLVDEIHLLCNRDSAGGRALMKMGGAAGHRVGMSGTYVRNRFENLWTTNRFVYPERSGVGDIADISANRWIDDNCKTVYDHFAPGNRRVVGELEEGSMASRIPCWRQHFKRRECCEFHPHGFLADLPEPMQIREYVELTSGQQKAIKQMERDYLAYLDLATKEWQALPPTERKRKPLITKLPIVRETRLSQMTLAMPSIVPRPYKPRAATKTKTWEDMNRWTETTVDGEMFKQACDDRGIPLWDVIFEPDADSPKLDRLVEIFRKVEEPMVAATNSKKFADIIGPRLEAEGIRTFIWSSDANEAQRDAALTAFENGEIDIVVGVTEAIGTGIDGLQMASGVLVSLNKSRDLTSETQLEGRLDRRGQKREKGVLHFEIIAEGSPDEGIIDDQLRRRLELNRSLQKNIGRAA